ncbi:MAG: CD1247 N-terminal domain-containing protein [Acetanaerobacterium sp.]
MTATERVAYIKGLMEGLGMDDSTNEGKVLKAMVEVLDDLASDLADTQDELSELYDHVDAIDEDLGLLEEDFYEMEDEDEDEDDCCCEDDEDCLYEVVCPSCGDTICINEAMLEEGVIDCPGCGEKLEFDFDDDECCDSKDCDCGKHE